MRDLINNNGIRFSDILEMINGHNVETAKIEYENVKRNNELSQEELQQAMERE
jgi:hypothetical protein